LIDEIIKTVKGVDDAIKNAGTLPVQLIVIFFLWLIVSIPLYLLGVIGAYIAGGLIALSVISNIIWSVLCIIISVLLIKKYLENNSLL